MWDLLYIHLASWVTPDCVGRARHGLPRSQPGTSQSLSAPVGERVKKKSTFADYYAIHTSMLVFPLFL